RAAALLEALEIRRLAVLARHGPRGALLRHLVELVRLELDLAAASRAGRDRLQQRLRELAAVLARLLRAHAADRQEAHAAVDVEADAAGRDHAALGRIEGRHAADREAVAPVNVGHRERRADDARQARDVRDLLEARI